MAEIEQITCETAWQMLLDNEETILVDVRTETEWRTVGIPDTSQTGRAARSCHGPTSTEPRIRTSPTAQPMVLALTLQFSCCAVQAFGPTQQLSCSSAWGTPRPST